MIWFADRESRARSLKTVLRCLVAALVTAACSDVKAPPEGDVDAPILRSIEFATTQVEAGDTIEVLAQLQDAEGVERVVITAGAQPLDIGRQCTAQRLSRLGNIERWICNIALPDTLSAASWTIIAVEAEDVAGNRVLTTPASSPEILIVAPAVVTVRIRSNPTVTLMRGDSYGFSAEAFDVRDRAIQRPLSFEWSSSEPLVASITPSARVNTAARI